MITFVLNTLIFLRAIYFNLCEIERISRLRSPIFRCDASLRKRQSTRFM